MLKNSLEYIANYHGIPKSQQKEFIGDIIDVLDRLKIHGYKSAAQAILVNNSESFKIIETTERGQKEYAVISDMEGFEDFWINCFPAVSSAIRYCIEQNKGYWWDGIYYPKFNINQNFKSKLQ